MQSTYVHELDAATANRIARLIETRAVLSASGCLVWTGTMATGGYGNVGVRVDGVLRYTGIHRVAWILANGPIRPGLVIDHLCRNRACCNPEHLEPVTSGENTRRSDLIGRRSGPYRKRAACKKGHELTPENTRTYVGRDGYPRRTCIECRDRRTRELSARRRTR